jgi:HSP20 family protein
MSVTRFDPFLFEVGGLRHSMERMFDEMLLRNPRRSVLAVIPKKWEPPIEMFETASEIIVRAELPNTDPKAVDITVNEDIFTLKGDTKHEEEHKERNYFYREFVYGAFTRTIKLPVTVKGAEAKAVYKDGVLEVTMPKAAQVKPVPVKVQTAA